METKAISFTQFVRNFHDNECCKKYFLSRGLSYNLVNDNLIGYCPVYSRYTFSLLRGRLIIPIHDVNGNVIAMAGRQIPELIDDVKQSFWDFMGQESPAKCQEKINQWTKGKWINEPYQKTKNLFFLNKSKEEVLKKNYIILVEGYFDAYGLYDSGLKNVAALCGTSISDYQIALALRYCDNIAILMDSDGPGINASNTISKKISDLGGKSFKIFLPTGYDPDEFSKNYHLDFFDHSIKSMIENNKNELHVRV